MSIWRKIGKATAIAAVLLLLVLIGAVLFLQSQYGKDKLIQFAEEAVSDPAAGTALDLGRLEGSLFSSLTLDAATLSDREGAWLTIRDLALRWDPWALLSAELDVAELAVGEIGISRAPQTEEPKPAAAAEPSSVSWPELPVAINLQKVHVKRIAIGEQLLGRDALLEFQGNVTADPAGPLFAKLALERRDGTKGHLTANISAQPSQETFDLSLSLSDPKGGLISSALAQPDFPDVTLSLEGDGNLESWQGTLVGQVGEITALQSELRLTLKQPYGLAAQGAANVVSFLEPPVQEFLSPQMGFDLAAAFEPKSERIDVTKLALESDALALEGALQIDVAQNGLSGKTFIHARDTAPINRLAAPAEMGGIAATLDIGGQITAPSLVLDLVVEDAKLPPASLSAIKTRISTALPEDPANPITFSGEGSLEGVTAGDPALDQVHGGQIDFRAGGSFETGSGVLDLTQFSVIAGILTSDTQGQFATADGRAQFDTRVEVTDLAPLSDLAAVPLAGSLGLDLSLESANIAEGLAANISAQVQQLTFGQADLEQVIGPSLDIQASLRQGPAGLALENLSLAGQAFTSRVSGTLAAESSALSATYESEIQTLAPLSRRAGTDLTGRLQVSGALDGTLESPNLTGQLELKDAKARDIAVSLATLAYEAADLLRQPRGTLAFDADTSLGQIAAGTEFALAGETLSLDAIELASRGSKIGGQSEIPLNGSPILAQLSAEVTDLSAWSDLAGLPLAGRITADVGLADAAGLQDATVVLEGAELAAEDTTIGAVSAQAKLSDLLNQPQFDVTATLESLKTGAIALTETNAAAKGTLEEIDFELSTRGEAGHPIEIATRGRFRQQEDNLTIDLQALEGQLAGRPLKLADAARITTSQDLLTFEGLDLELAGGRIAGAGNLAADSLALDFDLRDIPLSLATLVQPDLPLSGTLQGAAQISGSPEVPKGNFSLVLADLASGVGPAAELPPLQVRLDGSLAKDSLSFEGGLTGLESSSVGFTGAVPLRLTGAPFAAGLLDEPVKLDLEIARLPLTLAALAAPELAMEGEVNGKAQFSGLLSAPAGAFDLSLSGYRLLQEGMENLPPIDAAITGTLGRESLTLGGDVTGLDGGSLGFESAVPLKVSAAPFAVTLLDLPIEFDLALRQLPLALAGKVSPALDLQGQIEGTAKFSGLLSAPEGSFDLQLTQFELNNEATEGLPPLDVLIQGGLSEGLFAVTGDLEGLEDGGIAFDGKLPVSLSADPFVFELPDESASLDLTIERLPLSLAALAAPDLKLEGALDGTASLTGRLAAPVTKFDVNLSQFRLQNPATEALPPLAVALKGDLSGDAFAVDGQIAGLEDGAVDFDSQVPVRFSAVPFELALLDQPLVLDLAIRKLPLALAALAAPDVNLSGSLEGTAKLQGRLSAPQADFDLAVSQLQLHQETAAQLPPLDATFKGAFRDEQLSTAGTLTGFEQGSLTFDSRVPVKVSAEPFALALLDDPITLDLAIQQLPLSLAALAAPDLNLQGELAGTAKLSGRLSDPRGDFDFTLAQMRLLNPATEKLPPLDAALKGALSEDRLDLDALLSGLEGGSLVLKGYLPVSVSAEPVAFSLLDEPVAFDLAIQKLPLGIAALVVPELAMEGALEGTANLGGLLSAPQADFDLAVSRFKMDDPALQGLPALDAELKGDLKEERLAFDGGVSGLDGGSLALQGQVPLLLSAAPFAFALLEKPVSLDLALRQLPLSLARVAAPDLKMDGTLEGKANLGGLLSAPQADFDLAVTRFKMDDPALQGLPALDAELKGDLKEERLAFDGGVSGLDGGSLALEGQVPLQLSAAPFAFALLEKPVRLELALRQLPLSLARVAAPDLKMEGTLEGKAEVDGLLSAPEGQFDMALSGFRLQQDAAAKLPPLDAEMTGGLSSGTFQFDGTLSGLSGGSLDLNGKLPVKVSAQPAAFALGNKNLQVDLALNDLPLSLASLAAPDLKLEGDLNGALRMNGSLAAPQGDFEFALRDFHLDDPKLKDMPKVTADLSGALAAQTLSFEGSASGSTGGEVTIDGRLHVTVSAQPAAFSLPDQPANLQLAIRELPLALAKLAQPDLELAGQLNGDASLNGTLGNPAADFAIRAEGISVGGDAGEDIPELNLIVDGDLRGNRLNTEGKVEGLPGSGLGFALGLPVQVSADPPAFALPPNGNLEGRITFDGDVKTLGDTFVPDPHRLTGKASAQLALSGTLADPRISGPVRLQNGSYENLETGTILEDAEIDLRADGTKITLAALSANDGQAGRLSGSGDIDVDPEQAFPMDIALKFDNAHLVRRDDVSAVASGDLTLKGDLTESFLKGRIETSEIEVRLIDTLPPDVAELEVTEINFPPGTEPPPEKEAAQAPSNIRLDLTLAMPRKVFVRGRGLDSEWAGDLRITGTAAKPRIEGALRPVRGQFSFVGKTFVLQEGSISFDGGPDADPILDLSAAYEEDELTAIFRITGRGSQPEIELTSIPELPQDEVMARVLFGKSTGNLSPVEAVQLASAVASLASGGSGGGVLDFVRSSLGVDVLRLGTGEDGQGANVSVGNYLTDEVYIGVEQGTTPGSSRAKVEIELLPGITLETEANEKAEGRVGVKWKWDY